MGGVEVHACDACLRKLVGDSILHLLRAGTTVAQVAVAAVGTLLGHAVRIAAVVAREGRHGLVVRQRHVAVGALWRPAALVALDDGREAAAVLEEYDLLAALEGFADGVFERRGEHAAHHLAAAQVFGVHDVDGGQLEVLVALRHGDEAVLAQFHVAVGLDGGCRRAEHHLRSAPVCHHHGDGPCVVAWGGVLLLERCLVLLVDDDEPQTLVGQEDSGTCAEYNVVGPVAELLLPDFHAFGIGVFGVVDANATAEDVLQSLCYLHCKGYLW